MISNGFIEKSLFSALYVRKEGTSTSYNKVSGSEDLPHRLSISRIEMTKVRRSGRNGYAMIKGQLVGKFRLNETSIYKVAKPYVFRTQIWQDDEFPQFIGYGTIGITQEDGRVKDVGDLVVLHSQDNQWEEVEVFVFRGFGLNPDYRKQAMQYVFEAIY